MSRPTIAVVDDDESVRSYLGYFLTSRGYGADCFDSGETMLARLSGGSLPAAVILDLLMPKMDGIEVLTRLRGIDSALPVIILSAVDHVRTVVQAMHVGATDYLPKPFEEEDLEAAINAALKRSGVRERVNGILHDSGPELGGAVSANSKMQRVTEIAKMVADTDVPVLLLGESGVGKEVLARFLHSHSNRRDKPFVKVNCAALPNDLLESELFGYERGAFTGAMGEKPGKFELADKGTILLDEIGEMSPHLQAKLLHVLQDGEYMRLGGKRSLRANARILASTNRKLEEEVAKGAFREDLYYRLNVIRVEIPPLRERPEDIESLCHYFVEKYRERYGSPLHQLPPELLQVLLRYDWPGNIRQLENVIRRYLILSDLDLALSDVKGRPAPAPIVQENTLSLKEVAARAAEEAGREAVLRALEQTNWNRKRAARQLGICYKALLNKLKKWEMDNRAVELRN